MQATQEGLVPLKKWIKSALDRVIQDASKEPDLEFVWVGDDAVDPLSRRRRCRYWLALRSRRARKRERIWGWGWRATTTGKRGRIGEVQSASRRARACAHGG